MAWCLVALALMVQRLHHASAEEETRRNERRRLQLELLRCLQSCEATDVEDDSRVQCTEPSVPTHPTVATRSGLRVATPSVAKDMPSMDCDDDFKNYASNAGCLYTLAKPGQILALKHILSGEDVLAVLPCGGGKTALFLLPAFQSGVTGVVVVISPLRALMEKMCADTNRSHGKGAQVA